LCKSLALFILSGEPLFVDSDEDLSGCLSVTKSSVVTLWGDVEMLTEVGERVRGQTRKMPTGFDDRTERGMPEFLAESFVLALNKSIVKLSAMSHENGAIEKLTEIVRIIAKSDFILNKRASGSAKDLADVEDLME